MNIGLKQTKIGWFLNEHFSVCIWNCNFYPELDENFTSSLLSVDAGLKPLLIAE